MKITDSENIKSGERELIDVITGDLDWNAIEQLLKEKHNIGLQDDVEYKEGDIVVYDNQIAYKLNFDVKITLSVVFDRKGNCLKLTAAGEQEDADNMPEFPESDDTELAETSLQEDSAREGALESDEIETVFEDSIDDTGADDLSFAEEEGLLPGAVEAEDNPVEDGFESENGEFAEEDAGSIGNDLEASREEGPVVVDDSIDSKNNVSKMANEIVDMISEINEE